MAVTSWNQKRVVGVGGRIELLLPELQPGETVDVSVHRHEPELTPASRPMGFLKGKVELSPDFDEPLEEFSDYR